MKVPTGQNRETGSVRTGRIRITVISGLIVIGLLIVFILSGCTLKDVVDPVSGYFAKESSSEEETAPYITEQTLQYAQVNDSQGRALVRADGEPLTVMVAYETATGGEPLINSKGELETHPLGEVMTYAPDEPVTKENGEPETYAGGEAVTDILGIPEVNASGEKSTRAAGEIMTYGEDAIIYDENGERMTYSGEPYTHGAGELMYDTEGELATHAVTVKKDYDGEYVTKPNGELEVKGIELVTDASGDPLIENDGEVATRQLDPELPEQIYEPVLSAGKYYINNVESSLVYFNTPEVEARNVAVVVDEGVDPAQYENENGDGTIYNLQLEMMGDDLPYFNVQYDVEGYAVFSLQGTNWLLTVTGDLRNGVNVQLKKKQVENYPQFKYWDNPPYYTVADNQKWIIKETDDGKYIICSALDEDYVMTVDDQFGIQYANIMLWKYDEENDLQKFDFKKNSPHIDKIIDEGTYYIRSALSNNMVITLPDYDYSLGTLIYLDASYWGEGQKYTIEYDKYGFATFIHGDSDMALTVSFGEAKNDQTICQSPVDGSKAQKWIIEESEHEGYYIRSALNTEEVIDITKGYTYCGNSIQLYWNNKTYSQFWFFDEESIGSPYSYDSMDSYAQNFSSETEYLLLVNSTTNHVGVYTGSKGHWTNLYYWNCVTGKSTTPTIKGEFLISARTESFDGNTDSPVWYTVYDATMFYPQYFFHSIIYYQGTKDIMDASMGVNASHGCVRLDPDNAKWIFENIPLDTKVVSY